MTERPSPLLDAQELLQLAVLDINASRHDGAIAKLKEACALEQGNASLHFLLAAEHAEIGLQDRAMDGMKRALELDPSLHIARFQLGLIHFSQGRLSSASAAWDALDQLDDDNTLRLYKTALLDIGAARHETAVTLLERALHAQPDIPALRDDIARTLEDVRRRLQSEQDETDTTTGHALLHRYGDGGNGGH